MMAFLKDFVTHGPWFAFITFFLRGACSFKVSKKTFSKDAWFLTHLSPRFALSSWLKFSFLKFLKFLEVISLGFDFGNVVLKTDRTYETYENENLTIL